jgi:hypothetical protein
VDLSFVHLGKPEPGKTRAVMQRIRSAHNADTFSKPADVNGGKRRTAMLAKFFNAIWGWADYRPKDWSNAPYKRGYAS